jgi:hypothetical protein
MVRLVYDRDFQADPQSALVTGLLSAHDTIQRFAVQHPQFAGMGTTCTALARQQPLGTFCALAQPPA